MLDAYHATGDEYYYRAADAAASALAAGQLPEGGWNYVIDFAGDRSLHEWYATIGQNAWRLEEFQHDWGNGTFDDGGTADSTKLLLRLYLEKRDPRVKAALEKAFGHPVEILRSLIFAGLQRSLNSGQIFSYVTWKERKASS